MSDWSICVDCVHEIYLREQLAFDLDPTLKCSFCEGQGASPADSFVEPFMAAVRREYGSPDDAAMPLDPESYSGYWIDPKGSQDLFANEFSEAAEPAVLEKVADEYFDEWWTAWDWATGTVDKMLEDAWVSFTRAIQERSRFLAVLVPPATSFPDEIKPRELLDQIAKFAESYDLIKRLPARVHALEGPRRWECAARLGCRRHRYAAGGVRNERESDEPDRDPDVLRL